MATLRCPPPKIITTSGDRSPLSKMAKWMEIQTHRVTPTGRRSGRPRPTRIIRQAIPSRVEPVGKFCGASLVLTVINQTPTRSRARARGLSEGFPVTRVTWSRRVLGSRMRLRVDQEVFWNCEWVAPEIARADRDALRTKHTGLMWHRSAGVAQG